ncbi:recQ family helicase [Pyrenophora seminiperda CCB06]|uniref:RecQ family helicase n=1 Tax=Pyrenophora seminiperda CCB06 TaxID=1302712 RepID=A0A3M7LXT8_9PLEO|nr:recQ family helicase [Pyrenophora seminiperda CCB06]
MQIRNGLGKKAKFAQKVHPGQSTEIRFDANALSSKSKYEPDASFGHEDAQYPGVIVEVAYSQKKTCLDQLADNYILDSDASVQAVVCLHVEYDNKKTSKATLSIWRPQLLNTPDRPELRAVEVVADEAFRDDEGNPVDQPGLRLRLSDFTYEELAQKEMGDEDTDIYISGSQLCQYLYAAESRVVRALGKHSFTTEVKKRKRSETPPEEIRAGDEARYTEQEERAAKRADCDVDYQEKSSVKSFSD